MKKTYTIVLFNSIILLIGLAACHRKSQPLTQSQFTPSLSLNTTTVAKKIEETKDNIVFPSDSGIINIKNEKWKSDFSPIDETVGGYASTFYTKAYLRHLVVSNEYLAAQIASIHNLTFYLWLVKQAREKILEGNFLTWKNQMVKQVMQRL